MTDFSSYEAEIPASHPSEDNALRKVFRRRGDEVLYNCRVKYYPNEATPSEIIITDDFIFNPDGWESVGAGYDSTVDDGRVLAPVAVRFRPETGEVLPATDRGFKRARRQAYDYVRANNELDTFVTLTLDGNVIDRTDYNEIVDRLGVWLDNRVRRHGLKYILCPEYHADGQAIHFHGLMNASGLKLVNSGHRRKGKTVYNIDDYAFGFTTAIKVTGEAAQAKCAAYVFKYMTKQMESRIGGRYYLHGGALQVPEFVYMRVADPHIYDEIVAPVDVEYVGRMRRAVDFETISKLTVSGLLTGEHV